MPAVARLRSMARRQTCVHASVMGRPSDLSLGVVVPWGPVLGSTSSRDWASQGTFFSRPGGLLELERQPDSSPTAPCDPHSRSPLRVPATVLNKGRVSRSATAKRTGSPRLVSDEGRSPCRLHDLSSGAPRARLVAARIREVTPPEKELCEPSSSFAATDPSLALRPLVSATAPRPPSHRRSPVLAMAITSAWRLRG